MNKFTYAAFSLVIGALFFMIISLNTVAKLFAGIFTITFLLATMIKMILIVSVRQIMFRQPAEYAAG